MVKNPKVNTPKLAEHIAIASQRRIHSRTMQRNLNYNGFHSRTPHKQPLISENTWKLRLEFAKEHKEKEKDFWKRLYLQMSRRKLFLQHLLTNI